MLNLRNKAYGWLRLSERVFKTDMVYVTKGSFWLTLGHGAAVLAGLLLSIGFANLLSKESFGTYKFVLSIAGLLGSISLTGIPTALTRSVAQGFDGSLRKSFVENLKWSFAVFAGGLLGGAYYLLNGNTELATALLIAGSFSPFLASSSLYSSFLEGKKDFRRQSAYSIFRNVLPSAILLLTIAITSDPVLIVLTYFASHTIVAYALYRQVIKTYSPSDQVDDSIISYSKHLSLMGILARTSSYIDKILVFHFLGAAPLAVYSFALAPVEQLRVSKKIVRTLAIPKLSTKSFEELRRVIPRKAVVFFFFSAVITITYILLAPLFYRLLFPQYIESIIYSQLYALTILFGPVIFFSEALIAHQKKKELYIITTVPPIIKMAVMVILLPSYGIIGLIWALIIEKLVVSIWTIYLVQASRP